MTARRHGRTLASYRAPVPDELPAIWRTFIGPIVIGTGFAIGLWLARSRQSRRRVRDWHSMSAPSDYEFQNADEIRLILREAGIAEKVIDIIARGSWTAGELPPIQTAEGFHGYAAAVVGLEQLSATAPGVVATTAAQIAAALQDRMIEWERHQRVA